MTGEEDFSTPSYDTLSRLDATTISLSTALSSVFERALPLISHGRGIVSQATKGRTSEQAVYNGLDRVKQVDTPYDS